jgi:8-oxo-dGTP diphosphatase
MAINVFLRIPEPPQSLRPVFWHKQRRVATPAQDCRLHEDDSQVPPSATPVAAVGAVILNPEAEVLLVRRGRPPRLNQWSIPGGKVEWGETVAEALHREIREETGLEVEILGLIDVVDSLIRDSDGAVTHHHVLIDFAARPLTGAPRAGDDVLEAIWVPVGALAGYGLWDETRRIIEKGIALARSAA